MKDLLVVGLGNPLMGDEGVGVQLIRMLADCADSFPGVEFRDLGTGGMNVLHAIRGYRKAVFIDCAVMGETPGALRRFSRQDVRSARDVSGISLHETDVLEVIDLSRRLNECPSEIVLFGIEPLNISPGEGLSPPLAGRINDYLLAIKAELE